jgi:hypothetical protein
VPLQNKVLTSQKRLNDDVIVPRRTRCPAQPVKLLDPQADSFSIRLQFQFELNRGVHDGAC